MEGLVALITFVLVSTVSPGGATTLAAISGVQFGYRRSLPVILGLAAGLASLAVAASLGLAGVLLAASVDVIEPVAGGNGVILGNIKGNALYIGLCFGA